MTQGITIEQMRDLNRKSDPSPEETILIHKFAHARTNGWVSNAGPGMAHGIYDHFKGGSYISTQVVTDVDTNKPSVVYCSTVRGTWFVRPCDQWNELVEWPDGKYRSRFVFRKDPLLVPEFKVPTPV